MYSTTKSVQYMSKEFISRKIEGEIKKSLQYYHVVTLTGPRQSGKTTLCRKLFPELPYVNLEDIQTRFQIQQDPRAFILSCPKGAIIDEAHHYPDLFSYIQTEVDKDIYQGKDDRRFIITGSSNFLLLEKVTQSMAGRTAVLHLLPLSIKELNETQCNSSIDTLILNGGYPAIWSDTIPRDRMFRDYYSTYVERDARQIIHIKEINQFYQFIRICAGRIGMEFNVSSIANELGVTQKTINQWLNVLAASYLVYLLHPYFENIGKRLIKTPKLYFYDTGLAAYLTGVENETQLNTHPLRGMLFENMVINELMKERFNVGKTPDLYFYRDKSQREIDVIRMKSNMLEAYEIKSGSSFNPDYFKQLTYFSNLLKDRVVRTAVIYNGEQEIQSTDKGLYNFRNFQMDEDS